MRNGSRSLLPLPTVTGHLLADGSAYLPRNRSTSTSIPELLRSVSTAGQVKVTTYSPGGAPSPGDAVLSRNSPPPSVSPEGVNLTLPTSNCGWNVTRMPAVGRPLYSTLPLTGAVLGAEMPRWHPARPHVASPAAA